MVAWGATGHRLESHIDAAAVGIEGWDEEYLAIAVVVDGGSTAVVLLRGYRLCPTAVLALAVGVGEDVEPSAVLTAATTTEQHAAVGQLFYLGFIALGGWSGVGTAKGYLCVAEVIGVDDQTALIGHHG